MHSSFMNDKYLVQYPYQYEMNRTHYADLYINVLPSFPFLDPRSLRDICPEAYFLRFRDEVSLWYEKTHEDSVAIT